MSEDARMEGCAAPSTIMTAPERDARIRAEQIKLLYANLPGGLLAGLLSGALLLSVQWHVIRHAVLWSWFGVLTLISLSRYLLALRYRRRVVGPDRVARWESGIAYGTLLSGFTWGSAGMLLLPDQIPNQVFVVLVLAGMTAGAVVSYAPLARVALYFIAPALLPLTARLFYFGQSLQFAMGMLSFLFMVMMLATAWRLYEATLGSLRLRFENSDLAAVLAREKAATEDLNLDLKREIGERARVEEGLRESEARMRAIVDNVLDGIITMDEHGTLESMNAAAERIFGSAAADMAGKHFSMLLPEPERDEYEGYVEGYLDSGKRRMLGFGLEITGLRRDGSIFPMELAVSDMVLGRRRMLIGIVRDITERKRMERMKSRFISAVSHELRTPLAALVGSLGLLAEGVGGDVSAPGRSLLAIARNNTARLARLVGDIIDMDDIQSGVMKLDLHHLNLADLVARAVEEGRSLAAASGVVLVLEPGLGEAPIYADGTRLIHVIDHLISNAVRFSPRAGVVEVRVEAADANVRVSVTDHGPGVPDGLRDRLFQPFARTEEPVAAPADGAGLGLNIARAIVEAHGGSVGFDTISGVATRFYFDLPQWHDSALDSDSARIE